MIGERSSDFHYEPITPWSVGIQGNRSPNIASPARLLLCIYPNCVYEQLSFCFNNRVYCVHHLWKFWLKRDLNWLVEATALLCNTWTHIAISSTINEKWVFFSFITLLKCGILNFHCISHHSGALPLMNWRRSILFWVSSLLLLKFQTSIWYLQETATRMIQKSPNDNAVFAACSISSWQF